MRNRILMAIVGGMLTAAAVTTSAAPVTVGDKQWQQLTGTVNFSYTEVRGVCDEISGACSGSLGAVDASGWTWASESDVQNLFAAYHGVVTSNFVDDAGSAWADSFFTDFDPTFDNGTWRYVAGVTRTSTGAPAFAPVWGQLQQNGFDGTKLVDSSATYFASGPNAEDPTVGVWLHRATAVSEPSAVMLFLAFSLAGLVRARSVHAA